MPLSSSSIPILGLLTWRPLSGYELKREIEGSLKNFWSESFGQLYPQLHALNKAGLIERAPSETQSNRAKKAYRITKAGRDALSDWIAKDPVSRPPRDELLLKVFFASEGDWQVVRDHCRKAREEAVATLRKYEAIEDKLRALKKHQDKAKYWRMTLRLGISQTREFISWCDETLSEFRV